jgi:hypothetical protein
MTHSGITVRPTVVHRTNSENKMMDDSPTLERRMEVFAALVACQDGGASVPTSRHLIARRFGLMVEDVERIEREGLDQGWPPLA